ncbi:recombinase RecT [Streptomyces sp. C10-9-1]|uniref:recombinase RecT n=1 Tax=Streptomyces sp. C10-9-1 TaxID=1859285 RepID=UPI003F4A0004
MSLRDRVLDATADKPADEPAPPTGDLALRDGQLQWLNERSTYFTDALPRHVDKAHFISVALSAMPKLAKCTNQSIVQALLACARYGLEPDGRQAAIVPYGDTATFQPMYQGYIDLMYRSGRVDSVHFDWIRANDQWDYTPSAPPPADFLHRPRPELPKVQRGQVILAYAYVWLKGGSRSQVILLNREDAEHIRNTYSKAYKLAESNGKRDSAWHTDFDAMWAKSAVRRLTKRVPTSPELLDLLAADDDADEPAAPTIIRSFAVDREETGPATGTEPEDWPETAQPGTGRRPKDGDTR